MYRILRSALLASAYCLPVASRAATAPDPTDFLFRLGILEGHLMVGHELMQAGRQGLAVPHFGHPVREVYDDLRDYLDANKIAPFDTKLIKLEAAVVAAPNSKETEALYADTIKTLHDARATAPAAIRDSVPQMIKICADTIDAAAGEYGEALNRGKIDTLVEYHDSRGYVAYVAQQTAALKATPQDPANQKMLDKFGAILAKAQYIVQPLMPAPTPRATVKPYRAIATEASALVKPAATPAAAPAKP